MQERCYCGDTLPFVLCCQPYIQGLKQPETAEKLMRSRFSAFATENYQYLLDTYGPEQRSNLTLSELAENGQSCQWLGLEVCEHKVLSETRATVEFKAYYSVDKQLYLHHEISDFITENGAWRYTTGSFFEDSGSIKWQRNEKCFCGSGKKFKQCCQQILR